MKITRKTQMYQLLQQGKIGNIFQIWESIDDFARSGFVGIAGVRCSDDPGAPYKTHLPPKDALTYALSLKELGYSPVIYEASPDDHVIIQGEFCWRSSQKDGINGWTSPRLWLRYSRAQTHMRDSLASDNHYLDGRQAEILLRHSVGQRSWADFVWLSMMYPEHVFEFTAYDKPVGVEKKLAVIWECRMY